MNLYDYAISSFGQKKFCNKDLAGENAEKITTQIEKKKQALLLKNLFIEKKKQALLLQEESFT